MSEKTRVILCRTQIGMGTDGLVTLIRSAPGLSVTVVSDKASLTGALEQEPYGVLIGQAGAHTESDYKTYFSLRPDLAIVVLDIHGEETVLRLRDVGRDVLLRLIEAVAVVRREFPVERGRVHVLREEDVESLARRRLSSVPAAAYSDSSLHLHDVRRWLDLSLGYRLAVMASEETASGQPIRGWGMSTAQARALLGDEIASETPEKLHEMWEEHHARMHERALARNLEGRRPPLLHIADVFGLDEIETSLLWHCLAPDLEGRYARIYGVLNDDMTRRRPTLALLAQMPGTAPIWTLRRYLASERPSARHHLIQSQQHSLPGWPAPEESLAAAPEIVQFLLNDGSAEPRYGVGLTLLAANRLDELDGDGSDTETLAGLFRLHKPPVVQLSGGADALHRFEAAAREIGEPVLRVDLSVMEDIPARISQLSESWARIAAQHGAALLVTGLDHRREDMKAELVRWLAYALPDRVRLLVIHSNALTRATTGPMSRPVRLLTFGKQSIADRAASWRRQAAERGLELSDLSARKLAAVARFDEAQISEAVALAAGDFSSGESSNAFDAIRKAIHQMARAAAPAAVNRVETPFGWKDIVLPGEVLSELQSIPGHVQNAGKVLEEWGYAQRIVSAGVAALFCGPSGSGKTMAAQILAREMDLELFQIDLSKIVSKYIGETEKNLDHVFEAAERVSAVLLFDEADALFGKRTEVKDAHDRYANIEVAYLLQRMEAYGGGLAILTTNLKQNLDASFLRRLRFVVDFPLPGPEDRLRIWKRAFPPDAPLERNVDFAFLARRLELSGGNIQQIAVRAAFAAAATDQAIGMLDVVEATRHELVKLGMFSAERSLAEMIPPEAPPQQRASA